MGTYSLEQGNHVTVYTFQSGVYMRRWSGQYIGRPRLLAGDFRDNLTDVFWRGTVYYGYRNQRGEYLVRDASQPDKKYLLRQRENMRICSPKLVLYGERLAVFYIAENEWESGCSIQGIFLGEDRDIGLPVQYSEKAEFEVMVCRGEMFLVTEYQGNRSYYRFCSGGSWEKIAGWDDWREKKHQELEEQSGKKEELEMLQQDLEYRNQLIESIRSQYEELMETATKYREEAKKWRDRYIAVCGEKKQCNEHFAK